MLCYKLAFIFCRYNCCGIYSSFNIIKKFHPNANWIQCWSTILLWSLPCSNSVVYIPGKYCWSYNKLNRLKVVTLTCVNGNLSIRGQQTLCHDPLLAHGRNSYQAMRNQGQIAPKVTGTTDMRNTLQVPLTNIIHTGQSILLQQIKHTTLTESVPWWLTSCNKFACM